MPDNPVLPAVGIPVTGEDVGAGVILQLVKPAYGPHGTGTPVDSTHPLPVVDRDGTFGYAAGVVAGTVDVPSLARLKRVTVLAGVSAAATITIGGGATITVPPGCSFDENIPGDAVGADVVIGGTVQTYYVSWVA